jgi:hypothetical protein
MDSAAGQRPVGGAEDSNRVVFLSSSDVAKSVYWALELFRKRFFQKLLDPSHPHHVHFGLKRNLPFDTRALPFDKAFPTITVHRARKSGVSAFSTTELACTWISATAARPPQAAPYFTVNSAINTDASISRKPLHALVLSIDDALDCLGCGFRRPW